MLDKFCALVLIQRGLGLKLGDEIEIEIGKNRRRAKLVKTPFYKNTGKK
jgi:aminomethyltransferase